jgi:hypothetical protein
VTVTGTGSSATFNGVTISSSSSPALSVNAGIGSVTISNSSITCTDTIYGATAVETNSNLSIINCTISGGFSGVQVKAGTTNISGANTNVQGERYGLVLYANSTANITGGTFSGTGEDSLGIEQMSTNNVSCTITPASGTPVLSKGKLMALVSHAQVNTAMYYTKSENYDGSNAITTKTADVAYSSNTNNKYLKFYADAPSFNVTVIGGTANGSTSAAIQAETEVSITPTQGQKFIRWDSAGVVLTDPTTAVQTFSMPLSDVTLTAVFEITPDIPPESQPEPEPSRPSSASSFTLPEFTPAPTPASTAPEPNPYVLPSMDVEETESGTQYTTASGVTSTVTVTEDKGVKIEAGINESGSVNSQATAAAVSEAVKIAKENGESTVKIELPEGTVGLSKSTVQKLLEAAGDVGVILEIPTVVDGEEVGSISLPINSKTE